MRVRSEERRCEYVEKSEVSTDDVDCKQISFICYNVVHKTF